MEQTTMAVNINSTRKCLNLTTYDCETLSKQGDILTGYLLLFFPLLAIVTSPANLLVIAALNIGKKCVEFNGFKIYAISLALTDFSIGIICVPLAILQLTQSWLLGDKACVVFIILDYGFGTVSLFLVTAMAFDRYKCVSYPLSYRRDFRKTRIILQCMVLWISGIAVWIPGIVTVFVQQGSFIQNGICELNEYGYYSLIQAVFVFFLPLILTVIVYTKIGLNLRQRFRSGEFGDVARPCVYSVSRDGDQSDLAAATNIHKEHAGRTENGNSRLNENGNLEKTQHVKRKSKNLGTNPTGFAHAHISSQNRQCMKTFLVIVIFFVICWGPFCVVWPVYQTCKECVNMDVYLAVSLLTYANSAVNPFIYMLSSQRMRSLIKSVLVKLCFKRES